MVSSYNPRKFDAVGQEIPQSSPRMFERYAPSGRLSVSPIRQTRLSGWVGVFIASLLVWGNHTKTPFAYWTMLGVTLGALLILRGVLLLREERTLKTRWAKRMVASLDRWFPTLLFLSQTLFLFVTVSLLWFTLPWLGVDLHYGLHIGLYTLLTLITLRRLISEWAATKGPSLRLPIQDSLQYISTIIVTLLIAVAASHAVSPFGNPVTGDNTGPVVFIWLIAVFIVICCIILLIDRAMGRKGR